MKKNRKVFYLPVSAYINVIIIHVLFIGFLIFLIYALCSLCKTQEDRNIVIGVMVGLSIFIVFLFVYLGKYILQWVVVDENKITARNIFGKIREVTWAEVMEVREVELVSATSAFVGYGIVFVDTYGEATKTYAYSMSNTKGRFIKIVLKKKTLECLLQFKPDLKIVKCHD